ncbi:unnamed protein product, partial [Callosobruchus maculatus]
LSCGHKHFEHRRKLGRIHGISTDQQRLFAINYFQYMYFFLTGVKKSNIICNSCESQGICGMRYKCLLCADYNLCYICYHGDKHNLHHPFRRYDTSTSVGVELPRRTNGRKCELKGIFAGAKVVRGYNWEWGDQDGGEGQIGRVIDIRGWDNVGCSRSVASVQWMCGATNIYRLGHKGEVDLKFVEPASGGFYYPEHLPVLGHSIEEHPPRAYRQGTSPFVFGDKVKVMVTVEELKGMQQGHGGWNPRMAEFIDKVGTVHRITDKGDIRVQYEGCNNRWTFNPAALQKVTSFAVGDIVTMITDLDMLKELQKGHGGWIDFMSNSIGKLGKVLRVYSDGDLRVQLEDLAWTLHPACVKLLPEGAAELANTMHAEYNQRTDPHLLWSPVQEDARQDSTPFNPLADQLVRLATQGDLPAVQQHLEANQLSVNVRGQGGKTAMQVAAHQGYVNLVRFLLEKGASVNARDNDGDTCLHYATFGNRPEILELFCQQPGVELNLQNRSGCSALHIAAHKKPAGCARILIGAGADPNKQDSYGDTPMHDAIGKDNLEVVEMLCRARAIDFTIRNNRGFNVLHHAALKGKNESLKKLLAVARQLVEVRKDDGFSCLHLAALNGHKDVVETLINVGQMEVDRRNNRNQTALLLAVSQGHCAVIEQLVRFRSDVTAKDEDNNTALHIILLKRGRLSGTCTAEHSPTIHAIYERLENLQEDKLAMAVACYLVQMGVEMDVINNKGQTVLHLLQKQELVDLLTSHKPNPEKAPSQSTSQETFGIEAVELGEGGRRQPRQHRSRGFNIRTNSAENSPSHKPVPAASGDAQTDCAANKPVECLICSDLSEENVKLEPCNHRPACEDCSSRLKKCLQCGQMVQKRVTKDGRLIPPLGRQPSAERMRYLESKIAEIEESHACSICMERKRNIVFLCGHGACSRCADTLKTCHMCRKTITKKIPIY